VYHIEGQTESTPVEEFLSLLIEGQKYKINYDNNYYICEAYVNTTGMFNEYTILFGN
jgi:hypothetical protein